MAVDMCISCNERPVFIKKHQICLPCYQAQRKKGNLQYKITVVTPCPREMLFIKNYFSHTNWHYQPARFRLNEYNYSPDFYDGERNVFIEVAGTRQAYGANKAKYKEFIEAFPKMNFEIRYPDGRLLDIEKGFSEISLDSENTS